MATSVFFETNSTNTFSAFPSKEVEMQDEAMACFEKIETYRDITVVKALNKAKFPVYLINSNVNKTNYAMKVFAFNGDKAHAYFQNEARFSVLNHPNVIRTHHVENERETVSKGTIRKVSYLVMEYAPYGDFFDFVMKYNQVFDDMLIRTYFRQLIDGVEYLHNNGVSHMDLKLENLLMGKNFTLKIADFDLSYVVNDPKILSRGTKFYRPPELIQGRCKHTQAADIYSAGIILFTLKTRGMLPHAEDSKVGGVDFAGLLYTHNDEFWSKHCELQKREASFFDQDFKDLFNAMIRLNPNDRVTIKQIKACNWYNGPVYTPEELQAIIGQVVNH